MKKLMSVMMLIFMLTAVPVSADTGAEAFSDNKQEAVRTTPDLPAYNESDYSLVYDFRDYLAYNPDVENAYGQNRDLALRHFIECGMREGRQAKASFRVLDYMALYPDLRAVFGNDLPAYYLHYISNGYAENRTGIAGTDSGGSRNSLDTEKLWAVFDADYYLLSYPDLKAAFGSDRDLARQHFLNCGMKEARQGIAGFNPVSYRSRYPDLAAAFGDNWEDYYIHYLNFAYQEKRSGIPENSARHIKLPDRTFSNIECGYVLERFTVTDPADINALCDYIESLEVIPEEPASHFNPAATAGGYEFRLGDLQCCMIGNEVYCASFYIMQDPESFWNLRNLLESLKTKYTL